MSATRRVPVGPVGITLDNLRVIAAGAALELDATSLAALPTSAGPAASGDAIEEAFAPLRNVSAGEARAALTLAIVTALKGRDSGVGRGAAESVTAGANTDSALAAADGAAVAAAAVSACGAITAAEASALHALLVRLSTTASVAITTAAAAALLDLADSAMALTCEAHRASGAPFEAAHHDAAHPHRGAITTAEHLRLLVDGSSRLQDAPDAASAAAALGSSLRASVAHHGVAREGLAIATKSMGIEVDSAPSGAGSAAAFEAQPPAVSGAVQAVGGALQQLLAASRGRTAAACSGGADAAVLDAGALAETGHAVVSAGATADAAGALRAAAAATHAALCDELDSALKILAEAEAAATKAKAAAEAAGEQGAGAAFQKKKVAPEDDPALAKLSEAQRAKVLAKRAAKEKKAAEKAAKKAAKRGGGGAAAAASVALGHGSAAIRKLLTEAAAGAGSLAAATDVLSGGARAVSTMTSVADFWDSQAASGPGARRKPKIAKGARDFMPETMRVREKAFACIKSVFKRHGASEIDTPVFEQKSTLTGKYGEDSKLIYDLADQGGELLALRYDLTVPFARFLALHNVGNIKRYHIARVYRRDNPQMQRGRFREFYQCDFDVAGTYAPMVADAEVVTVACDILRDLDLGGFKCKLNHRVLLDAIFDICGCPAEKFRPICSAVDKLDKEDWSEVKREMVEDKGLDPAVADKIWTFVQHTSKAGEGRVLWQKLTAEKAFGKHVEANKAMQELSLLFDYTEAMGSAEFISFDLSLARGLDYYTGLIYEFVFTAPNSVGSVAAGGRYDRLVGMFNTSGENIPCVGVSMGIERIMAIMEAREKEKGAKASPPVQVLAASVGKIKGREATGMLVERMQLCQQLWNAGISAEFLQQYENPNMKRQLERVLDNGIPFMVIIGANEIEAGTCKLKCVETKEEIDCPRDKLVDELIKRGCQVGGTTSAPAAPAAAVAPAAPPVVAADAGPRGPAVALRGPEDGLYIADWDEAGVALSYGFGGGTVPSKSGSV